MTTTTAITTTGRRCRPLLVIGTRPEAIKMAPVVLECRRREDVAEPVVCFTGQHRELALDAAAYFGIVPDVELDAMRAGQPLAALLSRCVAGLDETIVRVAPTCVAAQGDTASVLAAALAAFYRGVPFVHVEAGLRTGDLAAPWPEEMHRRAAAIVTAVHCAPTRRAADALLREGTPPASVHVTGNTIVDAVRYTAARERERATHGDAPPDELLAAPRLALVTIHRRENFGARAVGLASAVAELARRFPGVRFVCPLHPNPAASDPLRAALGALPNVRLVDPLPYPRLVALLDRAELVLTDSGGIQEEAVSLGRPALVLREVTERPEGVEAGLLELVGTNPKTIIDRAARQLSGNRPPRPPASNPYGDGRAAQRIVDLMLPLVGQTFLSASRGPSGGHSCPPEATRTVGQQCPTGQTRMSAPPTQPSEPGHA
jgi:UDP-N-acetylglucosamine 2-epimerase (non-hydrolysing)